MHFSLWLRSQRHGFKYQFYLMFSSKSPNPRFHFLTRERIIVTFKPDCDAAVRKTGYATLAHSLSHANPFNKSMHCFRIDQWLSGHSLGVSSIRNSLEHEFKVIRHMEPRSADLPLREESNTQWCWCLCKLKNQPCEEDTGHRKCSI